MTNIVQATRFQTAISTTASIAFAIWWGGLTFYAAFVVPIGSDVLGSYTQGTVTRHVATALNWACITAVLLSAVQFKQISRRSKALLVTIAITLVPLFVIQSTLSQMMDSDETAGFYSHHRWYLVVTTIQWIAGLCLMVIQPWHKKR